MGHGECLPSLLPCATDCTCNGARHTQVEIQQDEAPRCKGTLKSRSNGDSATKLRPLNLQTETDVSIAARYLSLPAVTLSQSGVCVIARRRPSDREAATYLPRSGCHFITKLKMNCREAGDAFSQSVGCLIATRRRVHHKAAAT